MHYCYRMPLIRLDFRYYKGVGEKPSKDVIRTIGMNLGGMPLPADKFYEITKSTKTRASMRRESILLIENRFVLVSGPFVETAKQFDCGDAGFYPTTIMKRSMDEALATDFHYWNFGNRKRTLLPDACLNLKPVLKGGKVIAYSDQQARDDDLAVSHDALKGPAFWVESGLSGTVFFQPDFIAALRKAKLVTPMKLHRVRVV